jgi:squalene-hopene/tetraprenyl-beta-curcumene cyclase
MPGSSSTVESIINDFICQLARIVEPIVPWQVGSQSQPWLSLMKVMGTSSFALDAVLKKQSPEEMDALPTKDKASPFPYFCYPFFFRETFPQVPEEQLVPLAAASRLYMHYSMALDALADNAPDLPDSTALLLNWQLVQIHNLLYSLFPQEVPFWNYYSQYLTENIQAQILERERHWKQFTSYTKEEFLCIAAGKIAMSKCTPAALAVLSGAEHKLPALAASHDAYNAACQLIDDLEDWKEDFTSGHYSYLLTRTILEHPTLYEQMENGISPSRQEVAKALFFSGLAEETLGWAVQLCREAEMHVADLHCPQWLKVIGESKRNCQNLGIDLTNLRRKQLILAEPDKDTMPGSFVEKETVRQACLQALRFLINQQQEQGYWSDFILPGQPNTSWVTGYVALAIQECNLQGDPLAQVCLQKASNWLLTHRFPGWGYNEYDVCEDADSTAFCAKFLLEYGIAFEEIENDIAILVRNQHADGGIGTYLFERLVAKKTADPQSAFRLPPKEYDGWCASHQSVTAAGVIALYKTGRPEYQPYIKKALKYICKSQAPAGYWPCYWWNDWLYPTATCLKALSQEQNEYLPAIRKACDWLSAIQNRDGGWHNGIGGASVAFYTALAVYSLLLTGNDPENSEIQKGVRWLLLSQLQDGSWLGHPILRIPQFALPHDLTPWMEAPRGEGWRLAKDWNRIFTTATVLFSLGMYWQMNNG